MKIRGKYIYIFKFKIRGQKKYIGLKIRDIEVEINENTKRVRKIDGEIDKIILKNNNLKRD